MKWRYLVLWIIMKNLCCKRGARPGEGRGARRRRRREGERSGARGSHPAGGVADRQNKNMRAARWANCGRLCNWAQRVAAAPGGPARRRAPRRPFFAWATKLRSSCTAIVIVSTPT
jgi:hypothetical protein